MSRSPVRLAAAAMAMTFAPPLSAQQDADFARAVASIDERLGKIDAIEGVIPGRAVVMVKAGLAPETRVHGRTRNDAKGVAVTPDTPFYIASMTKAFVGLMALRLDERGLMPLDSTLADYFPDMRVEGVNMRAVTMAKLLSHQSGFRAPALNQRTAYTDSVPVADYATIVNATGVKTKEGFEYSNLGYLLYAAALEKKTGRSWRAWIDDVVLEPLGMTHSSARTSDFVSVTANHVQSGHGLTLFEPKSDAVMHAAGGLVVSPADMARWLAAHAGGESGIAAATIRASHAQQAAVDLKDGPIRCTGYAFGWNRCELNGVPFLAHDGGYTGMRSEMAVLPQHGIAFAAMFNSDNMTGGLARVLLQTFVATYAGFPDRVPPPDALVAGYRERVAQLAVNRAREAVAARAAPHFGDWSWRPTLADRAAIAGTYRSPALGDLVLATDGERLIGTSNGTPIAIEPAGRDVLAVRRATSSNHDPVRVVRDTAGNPVALNGYDASFLRLPGK